MSPSPETTAQNGQPASPDTDKIGREPNSLRVAGIGANPVAPASTGPVEPSLIDELDREEKAFSVQILQFFLFPLLLVITCLAIFFVFGLAESREKRVTDLVTDIRQGGSHARKVAAHQLARLMAEEQAVATRDGKPSVILTDPQIPDALLDTLGDAATRRDPDFVQFLVMAGGATRDQRFVPVIIDLMQDYYKKRDGAPVGDPNIIVGDREVEFYMALARLASPEMIGPLTEFYNAGDDDTKKLVVHAIGGVQHDDATRFLIDKGLTENAVNVRWNAALQLAARKNTAAVPTVTQMLDPAYVAEAPGIRADQIRDTLLAACMAAATLKAPELREPLNKLGSFSDIRIAGAAKAALEEFDKGAKTP